jgi:cbb3-type cytochrome oxidase subunit 3
LAGLFLLLAVLVGPGGLCLVGLFFLVGLVAFFLVFLAGLFLGLFRAKYKSQVGHTHEGVQNRLMVP